MLDESERRVGEGERMNEREAETSGRAHLSRDNLPCIQGASRLLHFYSVVNKAPLRDMNNFFSLISFSKKYRH